jgi:hypothetical protein
MQRSISYYRPLTPLIYIALFVLYSSLSSIYLFLPPLFAILFTMFTKALERKDIIFIALVSFCLIIFEANHGYMFFSSIVYFYLIHKFAMPKIIQNFSCNFCIKISYVLFAYMGYYLFLLLISNIFLFSSPELNYYIIYYIVIEFLLVSIL